MPKHEIRQPGKKADTGGYSAGVECDGWLFVSGQGPLDMATGQVIEGTIEEETRLTLQNVGSILQAAGCSYDDVVKCTVHLQDRSHFPRFDQVYREFFRGVRPARTTVGSDLGGIKIEIDCIAKVPPRK